MTKPINNGISAHEYALNAALLADHRDTAPGIDEQEQNGVIAPNSDAKRY